MATHYAIGLELKSLSSFPGGNSNKKDSLSYFLHYDSHLSKLFFTLREKGLYVLNIQ